MANRSSADRISVPIPVKIIAKLKSEPGGLGSKIVKIKEYFGVEVQESVGLCMLVGPDRDYLELVVTTLDHKYGQASAPANGAIVVVVKKKVTWKFFGIDAVLLKNLFHEELDKLKADVSGLNTQPLVVEIAYEPTLHNRLKVEIDKLRNDLEKLCKEKVKVPNSQSKIVLARQFATNMTDKSIYIQFYGKTSELCFFGRKDKTVKSALNEWQTSASATKPKHVALIKVTGNGGKLQHNEGNKLTNDEKTTYELNQPKMKMSTTPQQTSVPLGAPPSAVTGTESEIPQHSVAGGGRLQHNESNILTQDEKATLDLKRPQMERSTTPPQGSVPLRKPPSAVTGSESPVPQHSVTGSGTRGQYDTDRHIPDRPMSAQYLRPNASQIDSQQHMSQSLWTNIPQGPDSGSNAISAASSNNKTTSQIPKSSVLQNQRGEKLDGSNHVTEQSSQNRNPHYSASAGVVASPTPKFSYEYKIGKMDVKVYRKSVTEITGMDAIVNAANEHLAHGGGVAYYISQAAGSSMDQECRKFVSKNGPLRVTENFVSMPGRMRCKAIIHAVGPQWWHYVGDQEECARDLYRTIIKILDEAHIQRYRRIAMSAISAGIFGVPKQLCAEMYVKAFQDFEHRKRGVIQEIHFIDVDLEILGLVKNARLDALADPNCLSFRNAKKYPSARPPHPDKGAPGHRIAKTKTDMPTYVKFLNMDQTHFGTSVWLFRIMNKVAVHVYSGSIVKLSNVDAVVCAVDGYELTGRLATFIGNAAGRKYTKALDVERKFGPYEEGDVIITDAGYLSVKKVLHVVVGKPEIKFSKGLAKWLQYYNRQVLDAANGLKIKKIALPLLACGGLIQDIDRCCQVLVDTIVNYCITMEERRLVTTEIHLVNIDQHHTDLLYQTFMSATDAPMSDTGNRSSIHDLASGQASGQHATRRDTRDRNYGGDHLGHPSGQASGHHPASRDTSDRNYGGDHLGHLGGQASGQHPTSRDTSDRNYGRDHLGRQGNGQSSGRHGKNSPSNYGHGLRSTRYDTEWLTYTPRAVNKTQDKPKGPVKVSKTAGSKVVKPKSTGRCEYYEQCKSNMVTPLPCGHEYCSRCVKVLGPNKVCVKCSDTRDTTSEDLGQCVICIDEPNDPEMLPCGHIFCAGCLEQALAIKPVCPMCLAFVGTMMGNQPDGEMRYRFVSESLPGYSGCGTIDLFYVFPDGTQEHNHPSPGQPYKGTKRPGYLPDNEDGNKIFEFLKVAYDRKLMFTIGDSRTSGKKDVVTFNDIHLKTKQDGGPQNFGYPDPTYLSRVRDELAAKGIS